MPSVGHADRGGQAQGLPLHRDRAEAAQNVGALLVGAQNRGRHEACPYGNVSIMYDPEIHHRQSLRWDKHNYSSPGFYYVTICIQDHRSLLGNVQSGVMNLNDAGEMVDAAWLRIPTQFPTIQLDEHITMPNHFHGIIQIVDRGVGVPLVGTLLRNAHDGHHCLKSNVLTSPGQYRRSLYCGDRYN